MQDRVAAYPGRVKLIPVAGQTNVYDMKLADSPTVEGTPLNKANLLSDETAALLGFTNDAVPNEIFAFLGNNLPEIGTYQGKGDVTGSAGYVVINFKTPPKAVIIFGTYPNVVSDGDVSLSVGFYSWGQSWINVIGYRTANEPFANHSVQVSVSGSTMQITGGTPAQRLNWAGIVYTYIGIH